MIKTIAALIACGVLSLGASAGSAAPLKTSGKHSHSIHANHHLTLHVGESIIRANAKLDKPSKIVLTACHRTPYAVRCWVTEIGAHTLITDNGVPLVGDLSYEGEAR